MPQPAVHRTNVGIPGAVALKQLIVSGIRFDGDDLRVRIPVGKVDGRISDECARVDYEPRLPGQIDLALANPEDLGEDVDVAVEATDEKLGLHARNGHCDHLAV